VPAWHSRHGLAARVVVDDTVDRPTDPQGATRTITSVSVTS
jgi:hypothetical protein